MGQRVYTEPDILRYFSPLTRRAAKCLQSKKSREKVSDCLFLLCDQLKSANLGRANGQLRYHLVL